MHVWYECLCTSSSGRVASHPANLVTPFLGLKYFGWSELHSTQDRFQDETASKAGVPCCEQHWKGPWQQTSSCLEEPASDNSLNSTAATCFGGQSFTFPERNQKQCALSPMRAIKQSNRVKPEAQIQLHDCVCRRWLLPTAIHHASYSRGTTGAIWERDWRLITLSSVVFIVRRHYLRIVLKKSRMLLRRASLPSKPNLFCAFFFFTDVSWWLLSLHSGRGRLCILVYRLCKKKKKKKTVQHCLPFCNCQCNKLLWWASLH